MVLNYKVYFENNVFKYGCVKHGSYLTISYKNIKKIYCILNKLDFIRKLAEKDGKNTFDYNGFRILFDIDRCVAINTISNWLSIKGEVPIIKGELSKYIKEYDKDNVKDIIIKIKSLNKGSSNIIKEDLK